MVKEKGSKSKNSQRWLMSVRIRFEHSFKLGNPNECWCLFFFFFKQYQAVVFSIITINKGHVSFKESQVNS